MSSLSESSALSDEEEMSSLSSLSEEELDEDDVPSAQDPLRDASRVAITPHRQAGKGRPVRKTAAAASQAWLGEAERQANDAYTTPTKQGKKRAASLELIPSKMLARSTPLKRARMKVAEEVEKKRASRNERSCRMFASDAGTQDGLSLGPSMIQPTSSDAYFVNHAPRATRSARHRTSDHLISHQMSGVAARTVVHLTKLFAKQVQSQMEQAAESDEHSQIPPMTPLHAFDQYHEHWWSLLSSTNRPLLFYGVGSKRAPLQRFARQMARQGRCKVIVVRGEAGGRVEDIVGELERGCSITPATDISRAKRAAAASSLEARVEHLVHILTTRRATPASFPPAILLLVHNIDSPALLQEKSLRMLGLLAHAPSVFLCADTTHLNAAMLAGLDATQRFHEGLNWLWVDLTTYIPMLEEIIGERGAGISRVIGLPAVMDVRRAGAGSEAAVLALQYGPASSSSGQHDERGGQANGAANGTVTLSDRAAVHILRSVTFKARGLFLLLADRLLAQSKSEQVSSMSFNDLAGMARSNFLAMTPDALRALLVEFTSHGLMSISDTVVQVALTKADLRHVIDAFTAQDE